MTDIDAIKAVFFMYEREKVVEEIMSRYDPLGYIANKEYHEDRRPYGCQADFIALELQLRAGRHLELKDILEIIHKACVTEYNKQLAYSKGRYEMIAEKLIELWRLAYK